MRTRGGRCALRQRGAATAILSNGSAQMLAAAVDAAGMAGDLDAVLSVDAVRRYKPCAQVYRLATERLNVAAGDVVFVSSNRWDVMGAAAFGFRTAWVNRARLPEEYEPAPDAVLADLDGLAALA